MTAEQAFYALALVAALFIARHSDDAVPASACVVASWALCLWASTADLTPAQIILDTTGLYTDPYRIWALQDAVFSAWLASAFILKNKQVTGIVGLMFGVQVVIGAVYQGGWLTTPQPWLDALFLGQLMAIASQGVGRSGQFIRDWVVDHCRWIMAHRPWSVAERAAGLRNQRSCDTGYGG